MSTRNIPVYCINLKRATERRERMIQEWTQKRGIDLIFFEGIDKRNVLDVENLPEPYKSNYINNKEKKLTLGEICCLISHSKVLEQAVSSGAEKVVILEDDAEPLFNSAEEFFNAIDSFKLDEYQADIVLMHDQLPKSFKDEHIKEEDIYKQKNHHILSKSILCTQSILYKNTKAMELAKSAFSQVSKQADFAWDYPGIIDNKMLGLSSIPLTAHTTEQSYIGKRDSKKLLLLSAPRSGTHFLESVLNASGNCCMGGEPLDDFHLEFFLNDIKKRLLVYNIQLSDGEMINVSKLRYGNEKLFFYKIFELYEKLASWEENSYFGFKIFHHHLNYNAINKLALTKAIDFADKIIVLNRDAKEIAFSLAQAYSNNLWIPKYRYIKNQELTITEETISRVRVYLSNNFEYFNQIKEISKKYSTDKFLFLNYDEFSDTGFEKLEKFLNIEIDKDIVPFQKITYNYDNFFKKYESLGHTAERCNVIF